VKDIYDVVGERIRQERKTSSLTIEQLAGLAGISPSFLAYIETKKKKASLETIGKLAKALGIPVADLFKTSKIPEKGIVYTASRTFAQLIREKSPTEIRTALEVAKTVLREINRGKRSSQKE